MAAKWDVFALNKIGGNLSKRQAEQVADLARQRGSESTTIRRIDKSKVGRKKRLTTTETIVKKYEEIDE